MHFEMTEKVIANVSTNGNGHAYFNIQIPNGVAEAATFEMYMNGQKKGHQGPEIFSKGRKNWSGHVYGFGVHIGDAINGNNTFELKVKGNVVSTFRGKLFTDE
ncbi:peptidase, partial [Bacillus toyonensis]